jgi:hypothetical protein
MTPQATGRKQAGDQPGRPDGMILALHFLNRQKQYITPQTHVSTSYSGALNT